MEARVSTQFQEAYDLQYDHKLSKWRELNATYKAKNILDVAGGKKHKRLIDIGAGDGSVLSILGKNNLAEELFAVEISTSALGLLKARNISNLVDAQLFDGYRIPYPDKHFDVAVLSHVLEHVEHERILIREIKRVANNLIIEVPRDYMLGVDARVEHFLSYGHINMYTPTLLRFFLKTEGFKIIRQKLSILTPEVLLYNHQLRGNRSVIKKYKDVFAYYVRLALLNQPWVGLRERYCNAVTVFAQTGIDVKIM